MLLDQGEQAEKSRKAMNRVEGKSIHDLKKAVREVRIAAAERADVVVELRETEHMRLALLAEALQGVFDQLPEDREEFSLRVLPGDPPRFWIDATTFVAMARDKRTYQMMKDTRLGRTVLAETTSVDSCADSVTRYVAERIVEREQALEADWLTAVLRAGRSAAGGAAFGRTERLAAVIGLVGFVLGMMAGMFLLIAYAWLRAG